MLFRSNLVELFDQAGHLHWISLREFGLGFVCDFVLSSFLTFTGNTFDLRRGDEGSLVNLACISPSWLPVPSLSGPRYTHYSETEYFGNLVLTRIFP